MNKGDIFRWSFKEPPEHMPYHCCSCIAEFDGTRLRDTYWHSASDGRSWTPEEARERLVLTFVANREDLESYGPGAHDYYAPENVVDLRHPNNGSRDQVYIRKGAKRCAAVMRQTLHYTIERSESEIDMATRRIEECGALLDKINAGDLDVYVVSYN